MDAAVEAEAKRRSDEDDRRAAAAAALAKVGPARYCPPWHHTQSDPSNIELHGIL